MNENIVNNLYKKISKTEENLKNKIDEEIKELKNLIESLSIHQKTKSLNFTPESKEEKIPESPTIITTSTNKETLLSPEFYELKELLYSDKWPTAVDKELICKIHSNEDKIDRSIGIVDLVFDIPLKGLNVLDFGCGEGHVSQTLLEYEAKQSVGYDIKSDTNWNSVQNNNLFFFTEWEKVKEKGPYDAILLYDVIDHLTGNDSDIIKTLSSLKEVSKPGTIIFIRCHPFTSRHGDHLYHDLNKAFLSLIFNSNELKELKLEPLFTRKIIHPIITYRTLFKSAGFHLDKRDYIDRDNVEDIFINHPTISKRIKSNWKHSHDEGLRTGKKFPHGQLETSFVSWKIQL